MKQINVGSGLSELFVCVRNKRRMKSLCSIILRATNLLEVYSLPEMYIVIAVAFKTATDVYKFITFEGSVKKGEFPVGKIKHISKACKDTSVKITVGKQLEIEML